MATADTLGRELLENGGAERITGWEALPIGSATVPTIDISTGEKHSGQASLHGIITRGPQEWPAVKSAAFATETGKTYRVNFWIKVVRGQVAISMRNGANKDYSNFYNSYFALPQWTEYTAYYNEKAGGPGAFAFFSATGSEAEFYLDDVSIREVDNSQANSLKEWRQAFPKSQYVCWQKSSPWAALKQMQTPPAGTRVCTSIRTALGQNEYETASFVLTNTSDKEQRFAISTAGTRIPLTLRQAMWVTASNGNTVNDALPLLEGKLTVPSGESREVWLTLQSKGVKAGTYASKIKITADGLPSSMIDLTAKVYPVILPEEKPLYTLYWDYLVPSWLTPEKTRAIALDLKSHYVNVATAHPWSVPRLKVNAAGKLINDYAELDKTLEGYKPLNPKLILFCWNREAYFEKQSWKEGSENAAMPPYMSEAWKVLFREWLTNWVKHMKEKGYGYDRFAMNHDDETIDRKTYEMARLIKETDPKVKIFVNAFGTSLEESQRIAPYADIFCPFLYDHMNLPPYNSAESQKIKPAATKLLKKSRAMYWTYTNPLTNEPQEAPAYGDYRLAVWRAWQQGMGGFGYWVYSYKTLWNYYQKPDGPNWAVVYMADDKDAPAGLSNKEIVVPSKRWEATREGVEDYTYLSMLKDALTKPGKGIKKASLAEGRQLLQALPDKVLAAPKDEGLADSGKEAVLKILSKM